MIAIAEVRDAVGQAISTVPALVDVFPIIYDVMPERIGYPYAIWESGKEELPQSMGRSCQNIELGLRLVWARNQRVDAAPLMTILYGQLQQRLFGEEMQHVMEILSVHEDSTMREFVVRLVLRASLAS